ncbi:hypothetical protein BH10CYA1_BH10CYA1_56120 [soil metagenome]
MTLFNIKLIGVSWESGHKLLLSFALVGLLWLLRWALVSFARFLARKGRNENPVFWIRQISSLLFVALSMLGLISIWFDNPQRLTTAFGLVTAGLAFAMQNVVTSVAGYFVILRGNNFNVGDRITMGGVRGDVIALGFIQTTIMEMGQPPAVQSADPAVWVRSRQYTGRVVTVSNGEIFRSPVYNYTRDFPFIWEELSIPVSYKDDRVRAEQVLLDAARKYALKVSDVTQAELDIMLERYFISVDDIAPKVYYRITDNWLELTVRFLYNVRGVRDLKDLMNREILAGFDAAGIGIASATYDIVGFPSVRIAPTASSQQDSTAGFGMNIINS